ncbi:SAM-dependent methyltransferase [Balneolaceae bacterium ANBcel3]|nr:SAM-dependent methyltransferase [Balneolaceae bacterium ANBcel3]
MPASSSAHETLSSTEGTLYLIPTPLGKDPTNRVLPDDVIKTIHQLDTFFVERIRQAVSFLKWIGHPTPDFKCNFLELNKHTPGEDLIEMLNILKRGKSAGILSEAGCPAIADPGSGLVKLAHQSNIRVVPLTGPSSILLALMASGLNGQSFSFHGYLPKPGKSRSEKIKSLYLSSKKNASTQIFMETPYRNNDVFSELLELLPDSTPLCVASNLTLPEETIQTRSVEKWKKTKINLDEKPSIFLFLANEPDLPVSKNKKARPSKRTGRR